MKRVLAAVLCMVIPTAVFAGDNGYDVKYDGGSVRMLQVSNPGWA